MKSMKEPLIKGVSVTPGIVQGICRIIDSVEDITAIKAGEIVVLPNSHPMYALAIMSASAVICEEGGRLSHICIVSMEMGMPCITQARKARILLRNGQLLYLDAGKGEVYLAEQCGKNTLL